MTEPGVALRTRLPLLLTAGGVVNAYAGGEGMTPLTGRKWRDRFLATGFVGLPDATRSHKPRTYGKATKVRILAHLDEPLPKGYGC